MKKIVYGLLIAVVAVISFFAGQFSGSTEITAPPASWAEASPAAQAWRNMLVSMEANAATIYNTTDDTKERLLGLQYLAQLAAASWEMKIDKGSPEKPAFTDWMSDHRKFLGDSPDAVYHTAEISADHTYTITGQRGDTTYLGFMLYGRSINGWNRASSNISSETLRFDEDGKFELLLSRERPEDYEGDWLPLENDIHMVMVKQYFHDRNTTQRATFSIANTKAQPKVANTEATVAEGIQNANAFFNDTFKGNLALMDMISAHPNSFDIPKEYNPDFGGVFYPTHDNVYYGTWYELAKDQAIVIEGKAPDVDYWSVSLQSRWMQSYDYEREKVSLNNRDILVDEDGRYRIIISSQAVDEGNWLSAESFQHGLLAIRYQLATESEIPSMKLVPLSSLRQ